MKSAEYIFILTREHFLIEKKQNTEEGRTKMFFTISCLFHEFTQFYRSLGTIYIFIYIYNIHIKKKLQGSCSQHDAVMATDFGNVTTL